MPLFLGTKPQAARRSQEGTEQQSAKGERRRFGRWRDASEDAETGPSKPGRRSAALEAQHEILQQVQAFMMRHALPVTGANLCLVCEGLSGENPQLREAFVKRELSSGIIDQKWIDQFKPDLETIGKRADQMEEMMDLMGATMNNFHNTTREASDATGAYHSAVSDQLHGLDNQADVSESSDSRENAEFQKLLDLSRVMLSQIKTIEAEMERNQDEAEQLRESLAKARQEADCDHLTGLPNRRAFERRLAKETKDMLATGKPLSLAFCDIDHFKMVNDTHGHDTGDRVLQVIAKALSEIAGDASFVARHGGEEFVLLFPGLDKQATFEQLNRARIKLSHRRLMNRETGKPCGKITFSSGVAQVNEFDDPRTALAKADEALYRAKEGGRNKVEVA